MCLKEKRRGFAVHQMIDTAAGGRRQRNARGEISDDSQGTSSSEADSGSNQPQKSKKKRKLQIFESEGQEEGLGPIDTIRSQDAEENQGEKPILITVTSCVKPCICCRNKD